MNGNRKACGKHDLAQHNLLSPFPAHLIVLGSKENIRHALNGGQVRDRIISDTFSLENTIILPASFSIIRGCTGTSALLNAFSPVSAGLLK